MRGYKHKKKKSEKDIKGNGKFVFSIMKSRKIRGNYKDFVVLAGNKLFDRYDVYEVVRLTKEDSLEIVHKEDLTEKIEGRLPDLLWDKKFRKRTNYGLENFLRSLEK
jgi:hypothetical protein